MQVTKLKSNKCELQSLGKPAFIESHVCHGIVLLLSSVVFRGQPAGMRYAPLNAAFARTWVGVILSPVYACSRHQSFPSVADDYAITYNLPIKLTERDKIKITANTAGPTWSS